MEQTQQDDTEMSEMICFVKSDKNPKLMQICKIKSGPVC